MSTKGIQTHSKEHPTVLAIVSGIADICLRHGSVDDAYRQLLRKLKELIDFDAATVFVSSGADARLRQAASLDGPVEVLDFLQMDHGEGLSGWTADTGRPIVLSDRSLHQDFDPSRDYASFMSVPLVVDKNVVAVLNFGSHTPGRYSGQDAELASMIINQIALAFERLELERQKIELERQLNELRNELSRRPVDTNPSAEPRALRDLIARTNHDINNSLAILVGNVQCMQMENNVVDQKTLSRLKRMERALMKINEANHRILQLIPSRNSRTAAPEESGSVKENVPTDV